MQISLKTAQIFGARFRRAAWVFGLLAIAFLSYARDLWLGVVLGAILWSFFQLSAGYMERSARGQND